MKVNTRTAAIIVVMLLLMTNYAIAQSTVNYNFLNKPSFRGIQISIPQSPSFQPVNELYGNLPNANAIPPNSAIMQMSSSIEETNGRMLAQNGMLSGVTGADIVEQRADIERFNTGKILSRIS